MIPLHDDNPTRSTPVVTILLIAANVVVFLLQLAGGERLTYAFAMVPAEILQPERGSPFSPINPWMLPRATESETARFACTAPKRLSIPRNSSAGTTGDEAIFSTTDEYR